MDSPVTSELLALIEETHALMEASRNADDAKREELRALRLRLEQKADADVLMELYVFAAPRGYLGDAGFVSRRRGKAAQQQMWNKQEELVRRFDRILYPLQEAIRLSPTAREEPLASVSCCSTCGKLEGPWCYVQAVVSWEPRTKTVTHRCAQCGQTESARIKTGRLMFGYIYAAGAAHFSEEVSVQFPGLTVFEDAGVLVAEYNGRQHRMATA